MLEHLKANRWLLSWNVWGHPSLHPRPQFEARETSPNNPVKYSQLHPLKASSFESIIPSKQPYQVSASACPSIEHQPLKHRSLEAILSSISISSNSFQPSISIHMNIIFSNNALSSGLDSASAIYLSRSITLPGSRSMWPNLQLCTVILLLIVITNLQMRF